MADVPPVASEVLGVGSTLVTTVVGLKATFETSGMHAGPSGED